MTVDLMLAPGDRAVLHREKMGAVARVTRGMSHDVAELVEDVASTIHQALAHDPLDERLAAAASILSRVATIARQLEGISQPNGIPPVPRAIGSALRDVLPLARRLAGEGIAVIGDAIDDRLWARASPGQIEQVIFHLVVNGRDAMPGGGRLELSIRAEQLASERVHRYGVLMPGDWVVLSVSDTGVGMAEATLAQLFEPFFTTKAPGLGSGLGLATVYGIAQHLDGQVMVESEVGRGTTVALWLPRVAPVPDSLAPPVEAVQGAGVLVIDDDEWVRAVTVRSLKRGGYGVLEAATMRHALALLDDVAGRSIQAVVADLGAPSRAGEELARRIRDEHPGVRLILMTGRGADAADQLATVADAVLEKPFSRAELFGAVRQQGGARD